MATSRIKALRERWTIAGVGTPDETTFVCPKIDGSEGQNESEWRFPKIGIPQIIQS